ncbi:A/G-specific adenine glycosylase [Bacteroidia bacterium]|nr:A/G-specific adenine glycosylase [Bacteroidia bacterium]MDC0561384.1 A/G-specific adenine glycosylase [Bacteroidia bacterium]MDC3406944.1 A/G-specific adenine glycosylase [Bacteroidia bacterium]
MRFFEEVLDIGNKLINWYRENKRELPWRNTTDPYKIWLSEIILQQTRVQQGLPYYEKFTNQFPTINDLADASEQDVLLLWQGLGYYSRARNMHYTAKIIVDKYNGNFPENHNEILTLKGVGEYTAAAIASFAFDKPFPVLDGNVFRFISRLFGIEKPIDTSTGKKEITKALDLIFNSQKPALFNQAIMEFGATHCTPKKPKCDTCIFNMQCEALGSKKVMNIPVKKGKTKILKVNHTYMCFIHDNKTYIEKRTAGIWKNLYQFPLIEEDIKPDGITKIVNRYLKTPSKFEISDVFDSTHILSHRKIQASFFTIHLDTSPIFLKNNIFEIPLADLTTRYPVSILTQNYLKRLNL